VWQTFEDFQMSAVFLDDDKNDLWPDSYTRMTAASIDRGFDFWTARNPRQNDTRQLHKRTR
jgi:hypothetical protein